MTDAQSHLTEDERHAAAEGSLSPEQLSLVESHLGVCPACADDVARIGALMTRIHDLVVPDLPAQPAAPDEVWPSIRKRIEKSKVVPLSSNAVPLDGGRRGRRIGWATVVAAALVIVGVGVGVRAGTHRTGPDALSGDTPSLIAAADSAHMYEEEAQTLLDQLELRRAMLRPEAVVAIDHDLRVVDSAIAELQDAIARDPNNPALRRLLASSYRQKVDVLKRVGNAS
jgi:anti-sigma factor RsiW